jgi:hypothetical protein
MTDRELLLDYLAKRLGAPLTGFDEAMVDNYTRSVQGPLVRACEALMECMVENGPQFAEDHAAMDLAAAALAKAKGEAE